MSNITSETVGLSVNVYDIFYSINEASNGWFVGLFMILIWILVFTLTSDRFGYSKSSLYAGFATFTLSLLFWSLEMISFTYAVIFLVLLIGSIFLSIGEGSG